MSRVRRHPTHRAIVKAQAQLIATLPNLDFSSEDAHRSCWACGVTYSSFKPQRAHLVAVSAGGSDAPRNFVLLCDRCHRNQPDDAPIIVQLAWLRTRADWFSDTYRRWAPVVNIVLDECKGDVVEAERLLRLSVRLENEGADQVAASKVVGWEG